MEAKLQRVAQASSQRQNVLANVDTDHLIRLNLEGGLSGRPRRDVKSMREVMKRFEPGKKYATWLAAIQCL